jgi:hypothetical protein
VTLEPSITCPCEHGEEGAARDPALCSACAWEELQRVDVSRDRLRIGALALERAARSYRTRVLSPGLSRYRRPFRTSWCEVRVDDDGRPTALLVRLP